MPPGNGIGVSVAVSTLLSLPVRVDDILIGHVVDVILDARLSRALGFEVRCGDGEHRFLPLAAARVRTDEIAARTALALLDPPELDFYARRGARFRGLRAAPGHGLAAPLTDLELGDGGEVSRVVVSGGDDDDPG